MTVATKKRPPRRSLDHLPTGVPHHHPQMTLAWFISGAAVSLMAIWFWVVVSGPGLIPSSDPTAGSVTAGPAGGPKNKDGVPTPPKASDTVTEEVALTAWSVLSADEEVRVVGTLENVTSSRLRGTAVAYVFSGGELVATAKVRVKDLGPGAAKEVTFTSSDEWAPGTKLLVLVFEPAGG